MRRFLRILLAAVLAVVGFGIQAQVVLINENFDNSAFPPSGWTIDAHEENWSKSNSSNAGGSQGEAFLSDFPDFYGTTRFISPAVDLSNLSSVTLAFRHNVFFSSSIPGSGVIGVATRSGNGSWNSIWEVNITQSIPPELINIPIENSDANASDFQFCFYFTGFVYILDWYFDDILLESHFSHDAAGVEVLGDKVLAPNSDYQPIAVVQNKGTSTETFDVKCTIKDENDVVLFEQTQTVNNLQANDSDTLTFGSYNLSLSNALYKVEVSTNLTNDQDIDNNIARKNIYTYTHERSQVLLEIGTGTWCHFCIGAAMGAEDLIANGKDVAVVEYHADDDFSTATGDDRLEYYGMAGLPDAFFDGVAEFDGGSENSLYDDFVPIYEAQKEIRTGLDISISQSSSGNEYSVNVALDKVGPILDDNLVLYLVLTESDITFSWQGLPKLNFVQRLLLPDANGSAVDLINNSNLSVPFTFQKDDSWTNDLELIAFVQNKVTKEVLNTAKVALAGPSSVETAKILSNNIKIYPNPAEKFVVVKDLTKSITHLEVNDITGRNIIQIPNFKNEDQIDISHLEKGIYFIKMISKNGTVVTKKLLKD